MKNHTTIKAEPGKQELFITREFEASRELVFKAFTDTELIGLWLGPRELSMKVERYESKNGGSWRFINSDNKGNTYGFHGVNHVVASPELVIRTFEYEGLPETGHVSLKTARFEVLPNERTRLTIQAVFQSVADRDGMIQSGMERGVNDGYERLDELLAKQLVK